MVKFKIGFTIQAETLFHLVSKMLPIEDLSVQEIFEKPSVAPQVKTMGKTAQLVAKRMMPSSRVRGHKRQFNLDQGLNKIVVDFLSDGKNHRASELEPIVQKTNFYSINSIQSRLAALAIYGVVEQPQPGLWKLAEKYTKKAS
jgi:hypothetical protein